MKKFCQESSIHGVQYLTPNWSTIERLLWLAVIIASVTSSVFILAALFDDWKFYPTQITIDTTAFPVQSIPFPMVTVCPPGYDKWGFIQRYT